jgi:hypothetical protein
MKNEFPGYFRLPESTLKKMWRECIFAFDANFWLNFYRYSKETRVEVAKIVSTIQDRIWIPHQVAFEFLNNRLSVIAEQEKTYEAARNTLAKIEEDFKAPRRHPFVSENLLKEMSSLFAKLDKELEKQKSEFAALIESDEVQDEVAKLSESKIGPAYPEKRLIEIMNDGEKRYKEKIPPGYEDIKKDEKKRFGDLLLWLQLIDKALLEKKSVILVTGDAKEDWWWIFNGKTLGPRPELVAEMKSKTGVDFHMYTPDRFMHYAQKYLHQTIEQSAIDELKEVRKQRITNVNASNVAALYQTPMSEDWKKAFEGSTFTYKTDYLRKALEGLTLLPNTDYMKKALEGLTFTPNSDYLRKALEGLTVMPNTDYMKKALEGLTFTPNADYLRKALEGLTVMPNAVYLKNTLGQTCITPSAEVSEIPPSSDKLPPQSKSAEDSPSTTGEGQK